MTALTASDYRGALDVLRVVHESEGPLPFSCNVVAALRRLIPSGIVTYHEWSPTYGSRWVLDGASDADVTPIWSRYSEVMAEDPLPGRPSAAGGRPVTPVGEARRFADLLSLRQLRRLSLHAEMCRPFGIDHVMKLFLAVGDSGAGFVLDSQRRPFDDRDCAVLDALAPHLRLVRERHLRLARRSPESAHAAVLTAREAEIMRLVASGMTNREVAGALFISPGTVRKHLENAYAKLGVRSRAQAVAVLSRSAQPHE